MREHLANLERITGKTPQRLLDAVTLPDGLFQLWIDFLELHGSRTGTGFGPSRITFADIDAWQRIRGVSLNGWHIDAIRRADDAFMASLPKPSH